MTVPYVISREEQKELARLYAPKSDWASSVTILIVAVGLLILGVGCGVANHGQGGFLAAPLILISIVLVGLSVYDPTLGTWIRRVNYWRRTRALYRSSLEDVEWQFSFDEENWGSKDFTLPWSELRGAAETKSVIWLYSADHQAVVPMRVLDPEELTRLRRLGIGRMDKPLDFKLGLKIWLRIEIPSLWRRRTSAMSRAHILGLAAILVVTAWLWRDHTPCDIPWIIGISGSLLFILITAQLWYHLAGYLLYQLQEKAPHKIECSERGVHIRVISFESFSRWPVFPKFREIKPAFLLYVDESHYHILPKKNMSSDAQEALRKLLVSKLPVADGWS